MQAEQLTKIPRQLAEVRTTTVVQAGGAEYMLCHDSKYLYTCKLGQEKNSSFQKFPLPGLQQLQPIIKGYFFAHFESKKITIFEAFINVEENKLQMKFTYNLDREFQGWFLREVGCGMAELHLTCNNNRVMIFQFTAKGKTGSMNYEIDELNKVVCERKQLYGSKTIVNTHLKVVYAMPNFTSKLATDTPLLDKSGKFNTLAIVGLPKSEDLWAFQSNLTVTNINDRTSWHRVVCDQHYDQLMRIGRMREEERELKISIRTFQDQLLIQDLDNNIAYFFQVKPKGSSLIGVQYGAYEYFWTTQKRIVGLSYTRRYFKIIEELSLNPTSRKHADQPKQNYQFKVPAAHSINMPPPPPNFTLPPPPAGASTSLNSFSAKDTSSSPKAIKYQEKHSQSLEKPKQPQEEEEKQKPGQEVSEPFKPRKIISKKQVNYSKTLNKPKETPIPETKKYSPKQKQNSGKKQSESPKKQIIAQQEPEAKQEQKEKVTQQDQDNKTSQVKDEPPKEEEKLQQPQKPENEEQDGEDQWLITEAFKKGPKPPSPPPQPEQKPEQKVNQPEQESKTDPLDNLADMFGSTKLNRNNIFSSKNPFTFSKPATHLFQPGPQSSAANLFKAQPEKKEQASPLRRLNSQPNYYNPFHTLNLLPPKQNEEPSAAPEAAGSSQLPANIFAKPKEKVSQQADQQVQVQQQKKDAKVQKQEIGQTTKVEQQERGMSKQVKELFQTTTQRLLKVLEEMVEMNQNQPTIKKKVISEMHSKVKDNLQKFMSGEFTNRIERYFQELLRQVGGAQEQSIKFYKQAKAYRQGSIQAHLSNQEKLVIEIRQIQNIMRLGVLAINKDNQALFENLIGQWNQHMKKTNQTLIRLEEIKDHWQAETDSRLKRHQETQSTLEAIKTLLLEKVNAQEQARERKLQKQSQRLKKAEKGTKGDKKERRKEKSKGERAVSGIKKSSRV